MKNPKSEMTGKPKLESDRELQEQPTSEEGTAGLFVPEGRSTQVRATRARVDNETQVEVIKPASVWKRRRTASTQ